MPASMSSLFECSRSDQYSCRSRTRDAASVAGAVNSKNVARVNVFAASGSRSHASTTMPRVKNGLA